MFTVVNSIEILIRLFLPYENYTNWQKQPIPDLLSQIFLEIPQSLYWFVVVTTFHTVSTTKLIILTKN